MFRKLVSNLSFSPALIGQLSFYAKRLRKEEATRRVGLIFTVLALVVQSFAVFQAPEAANASTPGQVGSSPRCEVESVGPRGSAFNIRDNKAIVDFDVRGGNDCKVQVSANSFFAPSLDGTPYDKQILHDRSTQIFNAPGRYTMQTTLPSQSNKDKGCFYQVDLTYGTNNVQPVLAYGHGNLDCEPTVFASASCTSLNIIRAAPTRFTLKGKATATNAAIKNYNFAITLPNGQTIERNQASGANAAEVDYQNATPGTYNVRLTVVSSIGQHSGPACKGTFTVDAPSATPVASCSNVAVTIANRSQVYFTGNAQASGGATIKSYTFVVKNKLGVEVKRTTVTSSAVTASTSAIDIPKAGDYSVQLTVQTSLGARTNTDSCVKKFTIVPPSVCPYNPSLPINSPDCQPCPENPDIWIKDKKCTATIINTKSATNMTRGYVNATTVSAQGGDKLTYTITVENKGLISETVTMQEDLTDVLEYATLIDRGGATFNEQNKILTWPSITLAAGQKQVRTIAVQMLKDIPATNTGTSTPSSYDCKMANTFGNTVMVGVECPPQKVVVEQIVGELPETGPRENLIFAGVLLAVVTYFYARSRQTGKEIRLIRRDINAGTI